MTLETSLWTTLKQSQLWGHILRVENGVEEGTPDVNGCCNGIDFWVELKVAEKPKRETTPVRVPHFTTPQRQWLFQRISNGGNAYLLLQVEQEYILLRGDVAAIHLHHVTLKELRLLSLCATKKISDAARLIKAGALNKY